MMRMMHIGWWIGLGCLAGCAATSSVPVIDKSPHRTIPQVYVAQAGDSVYTIGWGFGVDPDAIIRWNQLQKPYAVQPGQWVRLHGRDGRDGGDAATREVIALNRVNARATPPAVQVVSDIPQPTVSTPTVGGAVVRFSASAGSWHWPAEGRLVGQFSPQQGRKGIQIAGTAGSPIRAAAAGEVVYVGQGLRGYGNLIILKHGAGYLSAYAHNQAILIHHGQSIARGQPIATMGHSGAAVNLLHFEIRKNGKPVDPTRYLGKI